MYHRVYVPDQPMRAFRDRNEAHQLIRTIEANGLRVQSTPLTGRDGQVTAVEYRFEQPRHQT